MTIFIIIQTEQLKEENAKFDLIDSSQVTGEFDFSIWQISKVNVK